MRSEMLSQENNVLSIKIEFEIGEFAKSVEKAVKKLSSKVSVPGFRKGHTPRKILEMRFGKQAIYAEAIEDMLPDAIEQTVKDYELDLIDEPSVKIEKMEEGSPVEILLTFEVTPEINLPELKDMSVDRAISNVSNETVSNTVKEILAQNATLVPVKERGIMATDTVEIEYFTVVTGEDGQEKRHGPDTTSLDLSQPSVRNEIRDALLGKKTADEATAEVAVEGDYPEKNLAGKAVRYEMRVKEVKEKILPEMTPEFFEKILRKECETEEAFCAEIENRLLESVKAENQSKAEFDAVELISQKSEFLVPETLVQRQVSAMKKEDEERIQRSKNITMEQYLAEGSITVKEYEENIRKHAENVVRRSLVLDKIAENMDISVEKEDFEAEMTALASTYRIDVDRLVNSLFKDEKRMVEMANKIKYKKTIKAVMNEIKINETEPRQQEEELQV